MAKTATTTQAAKEIVIPKFKDYFIGKDPLDPYSREKFTPWSLEFTKTGTGGMRLSTSTPGLDPEESTQGLETIFLFESPYTECWASGDKGRYRFCYSPSRKYSKRGYACVDENGENSCPFSRDRIDPKTGKPYPQNAFITKRLKKRVYFLARKPGRGEAFKLVSYSSRINIIKEYVALKNSVRSKMRLEWGIDNPSASAGIVQIYHKLERPKKEDPSVVVGHFDTSRFEILQRLPEDVLDEVRQLQDELIKYNDNLVKEIENRYKGLYEINKNLGRLNPWETTQVNDEPDNLPEVGDSPTDDIVNSLTEEDTPF